MEKTIVVLINRSLERFTGWLPSHKLALAISFSYGILAERELNPHYIADIVFRELNTDQPKGMGSLTVDDIQKYHREWPSLSVGDIVFIDDEPFACENLGWSKVDVTEIKIGRGCFRCPGEEKPVSKDLRQILCELEKLGVQVDISRKMLMTYLIEYELPSGETVEIHRCNECNGILGLDASFIDQVSEEVKCPMCENPIALGEAG